jgi:hypothetical protein
LAPATDDLYFKGLHDQKLKAANAIEDVEERKNRFKFVDEYFQPKEQSAADWFWWHQIFGKYFAAPQGGPAPWQYYLSMVHTASWAVIILMVSNHHNHWFAWVLCITGVFFGNGASWASGGGHSDPHALDQTAMLIRALKPLTAPDTKTEKE